MAAIALAAIAAGMTPATAAALPDDPALPQRWVADIAAAQAWEVVTGDPSIVVGIVDTGVDLAHPDLAPNAWQNPGEALAAPDGDVAHGTHVAGLVAARGANGIGTAGVCWTCTILGIDVLREGGRGTLHDLASGMTVAARHARIVNLSLESPVSSEELSAVVAAHPDRLFVVAAGNGGRDVDAAPSYPCSLTGANVLCVAADDEGVPAEGTNWGARTVHLAAPGARLVSTAPGGGTATMTGSSFAAALVSGAAALLWSWRPDASVEQVRAALLDGADRLPGWAGRTATGARLNAFGALLALAAARGEPPPGPPPAPVPEPEPVSMSASSASPPSLPVPLAVPSTVARVRRGRVVVRLHCRSVSRPCTGTLRALGVSRRFAIAAGAAGAVAVRAPRRRQILRVLVVAGERHRAHRVTVAR